MLPTQSVTVTVWFEEDMRTKATIRLPAVFAAGKGTEIDGIPLPSTELDCVRTIGAPAAVMTMLSFGSRLGGTVFHLNRKSTGSRCGGNPEMIPVDGAIARPAGKVPEMMDHVYGWAPPEAATVAE